MKILFLGGGNMAFSMISGLIEEKHEIFVIDPLSSARKKILGISKTHRKCRSKIFAYKNALEFSKFRINPSLIILAIKPQQINSFYKSLNFDEFFWIQKKPILSIVAGLSIKTLVKVTKNANVVRAMPNTPALVKKGITGYFCSKEISDIVQTRVVKILSKIGAVKKIPKEEMLDSVTAISGSGPGYIIKFISAIEKAAKSTDLPPNLVKEFILNTLVGSVELWSQSKQNSEEIVNNVASKGGTTEEALIHLEKGKFEKIIFEAILKARYKSKELSLEIERQIEQHSEK